MSHICIVTQIGCQSLCPGSPHSSGGCTESSTQCGSGKSVYVHHKGPISFCHFFFSGPVTTKSNTLQHTVACWMGFFSFCVHRIQILTIWTAFPSSWTGRCGRFSVGLDTAGIRTNPARIPNFVRACKACWVRLWPLYRLENATVSVSVCACCCWLLM